VANQLFLFCSIAYPIRLTQVRNQEFNLMGNLLMIKIAWFSIGYVTSFASKPRALHSSLRAE
ncbi:MAG: hypothetical protein WCC41_07810, partial [Rhodomicrobium sp.]